MQPQQTIPTLQQLAFTAAIPEIKQKISAIVYNSQELSETLKTLDAFISRFNLPTSFIENNKDIATVTNDAAEQYCTTIHTNSYFTTLHTLQQLPHLQTIIHRKITGQLLRSEYAQLPQLHISKPQIYALCLLNNSIVFAPAQEIIEALYPKQLRSNQKWLAFTQMHIGNYIARLQQDKISKLKNKLLSHDDIKLSESMQSDHIQFTIRHCVNYKKQNKDCLSFVDHDPLNKMFLTYSHNLNKIAFIDNFSISVQSVTNHPAQKPLFFNAPEAKKICFSQDDTLLFITDDTNLCTYNLTNNIYSIFPVSRALALHPLHEQDILILRVPRKKIENYCTVTLIFLDSRGKRHHMATYLFNPAITVSSACFSTDGMDIAFGFSNGTIIIINRETTIKRHAITSKTEPITQIMFSPDNALLVTISNYMTASLWHLPSRYQINEMCLEVNHTITGSYEDNPLQKLSKLISYRLPIILFKLPLDENDAKIQELCTWNSSEVWQKSIQPFELLFTRDLHNCTTEQKLQKLSDTINTLDSLSSQEKAHYAQKIVRFQQLIASKKEKMDDHSKNTMYHTIKEKLRAFIPIILPICAGIVIGYLVGHEIHHYLENKL